MMDPFSRPPQSLRPKKESAMNDKFMRPDLDDPIVTRGEEILAKRKEDRAAGIEAEPDSIEACLDSINDLRDKSREEARKRLLETNVTVKPGNEVRSGRCSSQDTLFNRLKKPPMISGKDLASGAGLPSERD